MHKIIFKVRCPICDSPLKASFDSKFEGFFLFNCPKCFSNIVYYDNKLDVISDKMVRKIMKNNKLKTCGYLSDAEIVDKKCISDSFSSDDLTNLKILLETSSSIEDFLSKI